MALLLELPGVYIDGVSLDSSATRPVLMNRDPEPGESGLPVDTSITLEISDPGPDGIDLAAMRVFVNGAIAFNGALPTPFQPGFTGPGSAHTQPQADTRRIVIDPSSAFTSEELVSVRVISATVGGAASLDSTYTFQVEDITGPVVTAAATQNLRQIRVTFDDAMRQLDASQPGDALRVGNYSIVRLSSPAVDVVPTFIETAGSDAVDVFTDIDLTPGASYRIVVIGAMNVSGVSIPVSSAADFTAMAPATPAERDFNLYRFLPELNRREDTGGDLRTFMSVLQEVADVLLASVDGFPDIWDLEKAPEGFVDAILDDLGNPFPFDLTLTDRRRLIAHLVAMYREKGTEVGIVDAIRFFLGREVTIEPFVGGAMELGFAVLDQDFILDPSPAFEARAFDIVSSVALASAERSAIRFLADLLKPAGTHFVNLREPTLVVTIDHLSLGESELGKTGSDGTFVLH